VGSEPVPGDAAGSHCTSCGRPVADCPGCRRELDPPRFCHRCGTRLAVRVSPGGFAGRCKHHGLVAES
jgi:hypothetical protein